ncbi:MAG: hypothetical protein IT185_03110 [Acidobacteria bacterium]|jgi:hypothetical protein|nr:hypothetical protein [Acidobacteriota bacterium]
MMFALYATIWLALIALLFSELGRRRNRQTGVTTHWAIVASAVGIVLTGAHILLALGVVYDWDHARAARITAERAAEVYGVAWPLSLYVNYLFLAWWLIDTLWWWRATSSFLMRAPLIDWAWRLTAFTMVINGAVIFASPAGRIAGVPLTAALVFVWWHSRSRPVRLQRAG